jgi:hypothetical protein
MLEAQKSRPPIQVGARDVVDPEFETSISRRTLSTMRASSVSRSSCAKCVLVPGAAARRRNDRVSSCDMLDSPGRGSPSDDAEKSAFDPSPGERQLHRRHRRSLCLPKCSTHCWATLRSLESMARARDLFALCVAEDPTFAAAWAWLGRRFGERWRSTPTCPVPTTSIRSCRSIWESPVPRQCALSSAWSRAAPSRRVSLVSCTRCDSAGFSTSRSPRTSAPPRSTRRWSRACPIAGAIVAFEPGFEPGEQCLQLWLVAAIRQRDAFTPRQPRNGDRPHSTAKRGTSTAAVGCRLPTSAPGCIVTPSPARQARVIS